MINKNLDLQQQALALIMKQYGNIPDIMKPDSNKSSSHAAQKPQPSEQKSSSPAVSSKPAATATATKVNQVQQQEEEIMQSIMK